MRRILLLAGILLSSTVVSAQVPTGTPPFGSFGGGPVDVINLANLNAHLSVPVINKAGRGLSFYYNLTYDSSIWYPVKSGSTTSWQPVASWGWAGSTQVATGYVTYYLTNRACYTGRYPTGEYVQTSSWVYHDSFGVSHSFPGETIFESGTCG